MIHQPEVLFFSHKIVELLISKCTYFKKYVACMTNVTVYTYVRIYGRADGWNQTGHGKTDPI